VTPAANVVEIIEKPIITECFIAFGWVTLTERIFPVKHFHGAPGRENLPFAFTIKVGYADIGGGGSSQPE
jgi:hypothetical protein